MVSQDAPHYGIAELAERGGVSRRTIRYYVQRGLLPAPTGLGRGKHYTQAHLDTLVRIRELQEAGVALAEIPTHLDTGSSSDASGPSPACAPPEPRRVQQSSWMRVALRDDLELHVRGRRLSDEQLHALTAAITSVIGEEQQ